MLGRLTALFSRRPRPVVVHTFHGHVLRGYFGPLLTGFYRAVERGLARISDQLICVSAQNMEELIGLGVGRRRQFRVIPVGLDLDSMAPPSAMAHALRDELRISADDVIATFVGRLVPIKRVDRLLQATALARAWGVPVQLVVVGDGELRSDLETLARELRIEAVVHFLGYRAEVGSIVAASDIAVLSSDNEGTPVSLIHAGAVGVPSVATAVGGVSEVVLQDGGVLVERDDIEGFARGLRRLAEDPALREQLGKRAREHVLASFAAERLVVDMQCLYEELLLNRQLRH
jgi:glycosyltransferase involved in cell wall biosynthesis